ncbi:Serine--tRNA ligase [Rickettsiales bacterium Ac37b]|nr:Serine--tRNA ligase [Rickettsiales bacterium Ac37b]
MHDAKWIKDNSEKFDQLLMKRKLPALSETVLELDNERRHTITITQMLQHARKEKAKLISTFKNKNSPEYKQALEDATHINEKLQELEEKKHQGDKLEELLATIPNLLDDDVPDGKNEEDNVEVKKVGQIREFDFKPKQHFELGETLGMMDFSQTAKISGSRFVTLKSKLARLERAIANFMLDIHTREFHFLEISPPYLVHDYAMFGAGQLPKFSDESFVTTNGYRLIPTGEVSLVNLVYDTILKAEELPIRVCAYTPCFRSEAGSSGRDTKGMIRLHQFSKVELVSIVHPEQSDQEHQLLVNMAETVLHRLELPYRIMLLCAGDTGFTSKKTFDLEVWLPGQGKYREISSCSNCGDFQARRLKARYKAENGNSFVHTLNASGLPIGRTMAAILENYQNQDGSINIPHALIKYMDGIDKIDLSDF